MKKNNNVFWIWVNSFFTDMWSEMIKPLLPIYLKVILQVPVWVITLFNTLSDFMANLFKIIFWLYSDKVHDKKKLILIWYATSNLFKPFMFIIQSIYWLFLIEFLNRIWKWIRSAPKEVLMTYSIEDNKLGKGFWFQKAMDSFGAFVWTLLISLLLFLFWLEYSINIAWMNFNIFYIIMFLTLIPWLISFQIIIKKIRNVKVTEDFSTSVEEKKKSKLLINLSQVFKLWSKFNHLMLFTFLLAIWNIALVFFLLELINQDFLAYQITLFYSIYTLIDAVFSYWIWKFSDKKGSNKIIILFSLVVLFLALLITFSIWISKTFIWVSAWIVIFSLLWLYEAWFEWTFKKIIVENIDKKYTGTALWTYFGVSGITKIVISLIFSYAWMQWKIDAVFWFWLLFISIASIFFYYIYKYKHITLK